jgi:hypothetical protein
MNSSQFLSALRSFLKVLGSILTTHGAQKQAALLNSEDVIGLVLLIGGVIWSHVQHAPLAEPLDSLPDYPPAQSFSNSVPEQNKTAVTDRALQQPTDLTKL